MSAQLVGELTLGELFLPIGLIVPVLVALEAQINANVALLLQLNIDIQGPGINIDIGAALEVVTEASLTLPSVSIGANLEIIADLNVQLALYLGLGFLALDLNLGGIYAYTYSGSVEGVGAAFNGLLAGGLPQLNDPYQNCNAVMLITASPEAWVGISKIVKVA